MKDVKRAVASFAASAALLFSSFATPAFADTTLTISGNGSSSTSDVTVNNTQETAVVQSNTAFVSNTVNADASTGGNDANDNTGGDVLVDTGNAGTFVDVSNTLNANKALVDDCGTCNGDTSVEISGNGSNSTNTVDLDNSSNTEVFQNNWADVSNYVDANAKTGYNDANRNTGGDTTIRTGNARTEVGVSTTANANIAMVGGGTGNNTSSLEALITGNGSYSSNTIDLDNNRSVAVVQSNGAWIHNDVWANAKTGGNDANDNTGGDVLVDTGNAVALVDVDNLVNFNFASVDCCLTDVMAKISGNGSYSDNLIEAELGGETGIFQGGDNFLPIWMTESSENNHHFGGGNFAWLDNNVWANAKTGHNDADRNTGEVADPSVYTGDAVSATAVDNSGNVNVFSSEGGFSLPDGFDFTFDLGGLTHFLFWA